MDKMFEAFAVLIFVVVLAAILAPLGAAFGALGGWLVGLFFADTARAVQTAIGGEAFGQIELWQLGAWLGFVGGFFKAHLTAKQ